MTATILLIRHAAHSHLGNVLSGRAGDVPLSHEGRDQARCLAGRLVDGNLHEIHSSPVRRARETAREISDAVDIPVTTADALDEIDFGSWSGKRFAELEGDPLWREWNERRDTAATPAGETMQAVQERATRHLRDTALAAPGRNLAMVTHCDVIRAVVAGIVGLPLRNILSFEVGPASISRIAIGSWGERLLTLNEGGA